MSSSVGWSAANAAASSSTICTSISKPGTAKAKLGEAIRYALTHWDGLSRFLDDGRVDIDNNAVERSIRPLAKRVSVSRMRRLRAAVCFSLNTIEIPINVQSAPFS